MTSVSLPRDSGGNRVNEEDDYHTTNTDLAHERCNPRTKVAANAPIRQSYVAITMENIRRAVNYENLNEIPDDTVKEKIDRVFSYNHACIVSRKDLIKYYETRIMPEFEEQIIQYLRSTIDTENNCATNNSCSKSKQPDLQKSNTNSVTHEDVAETEDSSIVTDENITAKERVTKATTSLFSTIEHYITEQMTVPVSEAAKPLKRCHSGYNLFVKDFCTSSRQIKIAPSGNVPFVRAAAEWNKLLPNKKRKYNVTAFKNKENRQIKMEAQGLYQLACRQLFSAYHCFYKKQMSNYMKNHPDIENREKMVEIAKEWK